MTIENVEKARLDWIKESEALRMEQLESKRERAKKKKAWELQFTETDDDLTEDEKQKKDDYKLRNEQIAGHYTPGFSRHVPPAIDPETKKREKPIFDGTKTHTHSIEDPPFGKVLAQEKRPLSKVERERNEKLNRAAENMLPEGTGFGFDKQRHRIAISNSHGLQNSPGGPHAIRRNVLTAKKAIDDSEADPMKRLYKQTILEEVLAGRHEELTESFNNISLTITDKEAAQVRRNIADRFGISPKTVKRDFHEVATVVHNVLETTSFQKQSKPPAHFKTYSQAERERYEPSFPVGLDFLIRFQPKHVNVYSNDDEIRGYRINAPNSIIRALTWLSSLGHDDKTYMAEMGYGNYDDPLDKRIWPDDYPHSSVIQPSLLKRELGPKGWDIPPIETVFETKKNPWRSWLIGGKEVMAVEAEWPDPDNPRYTEDQFEALQYAMALWADVAYRNGDGTFGDIQPALLLADLFWWDFMQPLQVRVTTHFDHEGPKVHEMQFEPDDLSQACQKVQEAALRKHYPELFDILSKALTLAE